MTIISFIALALFMWGDIWTTAHILVLGGRELNPVYGKHPTKGRLIAVHAVAFVLCVFAADVVGDLFVLAMAGVFASVTIHNAIVLHRIDSKAP